ncbi:MAG: hypothetical protein QM669_07640 [Siphonobacter sp.]
MYVRLPLLLSFLIAVGFACTKDNSDPTHSNTVTLQFSNKAGSEPLVTGTSYPTTTGETFSVSLLNYYISNVKLIKEDGSQVSFPDDYFLVMQTDTSTQHPILTSVPAGDYTSVSFVVGVDSAKSVTTIDQRTGVLDPAKTGNESMYWEWNSGYVFVRFEGLSPAAPLNSAGNTKFEYHIGGYGGRTAVTANNLRTITLPLPQKITVNEETAPRISITADLQKLFNSTSQIKISTTYSIHTPAAGTVVADNYKSMFSVSSVSND